MIEKSSFSLEKISGDMAWSLSHQTVPCVVSSLTTYLSPGDRPVCRPVLTAKPPQSVISPSPRRTAIFIERARED